MNKLIISVPLLVLKVSSVYGTGDDKVGGAVNQ